MKIAIRIALLIFIAAVGFAAGFPAGRITGFTLGSEWALVQADLLAREEGLFLPVRFEDGQFRVILKQPRNMYRNASELAARHEDSFDRTAGYELQPVQKIDTTDKQTRGGRAGWAFNTDFERYPSELRKEHLVDEVPTCGDDVTTLLIWQRRDFLSSRKGKIDQPVQECDWLLLADIQEK
jgi:hypothetical protein